MGERELRTTIVAWILWWFMRLRLMWTNFKKPKRHPVFIVSDQGPVTT
ncbi:hypothetical protein HanXRQr2_Chr00c044g0833401 [Helianthus annuus]|uniref:Uncharacterized protein n=1 Tax=Helianthus annuus TaxID=4232 RepID=A0A9K3JZ71_HELAN|nr:hypothetical protein HanXRQr2_Chr00c044g0833401 [Helianthus annuus]